jgi:Protein of unknown function (DUF520)
VKDSKLTVQAAIQDKQARVSGNSRDDLQSAIALVRKGGLDMPLVVAPASGPDLAPAVMVAAIGPASCANDHVIEHGFERQRRNAISFALRS